MEDYIKENDYKVNKYYEMLCIGCDDEWLFVPIYIATVLIAVGGFLIIGWVLYASCKKFARDGAQLATEKYETKVMNINGEVNNRIGKTQMLLTDEIEELK